MLTDDPRVQFEFAQSRPHVRGAGFLSPAGNFATEGDVDVTT